MKSESKSGIKIIAKNKKAFHDYYIEDKLEAGLVLQGWEVQSLRAGKGQLVDSYVVFKDDEAWLIGAHIPALPAASTHVHPDPTRSRKLLLHRLQIDKLRGKIAERGYTTVALSIYWKGGIAKAEVGLAKGKKTHDKRAVIKEREWARDKSRALREKNRG